MGEQSTGATLSKQRLLDKHTGAVLAVRLNAQATYCLSAGKVRLPEAWLDQARFGHNLICSMVGAHIRGS